MGDSYPPGKPRIGDAPRPGLPRDEDPMDKQGVTPNPQPTRLAPDGIAIVEMLLLVALLTALFGSQLLTWLGAS